MVGQCARLQLLDESRNDSTHFSLASASEVGRSDERSISSSLRSESTQCDSEDSDPVCSLAINDSDKDEALHTSRPQPCFFPHKMEANREHMTTVRFHNVPRNYTMEGLLEFLEIQGIQGFNFISLPFDRNSCECKGYAVVNFVSHSEAEKAIFVVSGFSSGQARDQHSLLASWNSVLQGLPANFAQAKLSRDVASRLVKPVLYKDGRVWPL